MKPFVQVNFAIRTDGTHCGAISSAEDWRRVHGLREQFGFVGVGANTWNADRPLLSVREERLGRRPMRQCRPVVFAGRTSLVLPWRGAVRPIVIGARAPEFAADFRCCANGRESLEALRAMGIEALLIEGGPTLIRGLLADCLVDRMSAYVLAATADEAERVVRETFPGLPRLPRARALGEGVVVDFHLGAVCASPRLHAA